MIYEATISSKGQITIPIEVRRSLGLGQKIRLTVTDDVLVIDRKPDAGDMWEILDKSQNGKGLSSVEISKTEHLIKKDRQNRGY
jgi:AbrB family looped-hinge helix DNA binding protein